MSGSDDSLQTAEAEFNARLTWLQSVAGEYAGWKFMRAKVDVPPWSGTYVSAIVHTVEGCRLLVELLDDLKDGMAVPLVDVTTYYDHNRTWPVGMRLADSRLVDTWPEP